jgi:hypothetical protein
MAGKISDKDILVNDIMAIERRDGNTLAVKMRGGYTTHVPPYIAQKLMELWSKTVDDIVEIKDPNEKA